MKWPPDVRPRNPLVPEAVPGRNWEVLKLRRPFLFLCMWAWSVGLAVVLGCWALGFARPVDFDHSGMSV